MQVGFKFFDVEAWSFYGTINCAIVLLLFIIAQQKIDLQTLILISLIGMLTGDIIPRIYIHRIFMFPFITIKQISYILDNNISIICIRNNHHIFHEI